MCTYARRLQPCNIVMLQSKRCAPVSGAPRADAHFVEEDGTMSKLTPNNTLQAMGNNADSHEQFAGHGYGLYHEQRPLRLEALLKNSPSCNCARRGTPAHPKLGHQEPTQTAKPGAPNVTHAVEVACRLVEAVRAARSPRSKQRPAGAGRERTPCCEGRPRGRGSQMRQPRARPDNKSAAAKADRALLPMGGWSGTRFKSSFQSSSLFPSTL